LTSKISFFHPTLEVMAQEVDFEKQEVKKGTDVL
jgi:hypothetical protein